MAYRYRGLRRGFGAATPGAAAAINAAASQYGIDPSLLTAVAKQESGLNQSAVSPVGAIGVMQLMPSTAASLGCDPNNMIDNIDCGAMYLSQLLTQFNGNTALALAAYNAGPGAVQKYGGIPPYTETQNYVQSIMSNWAANSPSGPTVGPVIGGAPTTPAATDVSDASSFLPASLSDLSTIASGFDVSSIDWSNPWTIGAVAALGIGLLVWAAA